MYEGEYLCRGTKCIQVKDVDFVLDTSNEWEVGESIVSKNGVNVMKWVKLHWKKYLQYHVGICTR